MTVVLKVSDWNHFSEASSVLEKLPAGLTRILKNPKFSPIFGHSARKNRHLSSGITQIDTLVGGGIVRGRISELIGPISAGRTSLAAAFAASATYRGEVVGWIDGANAFDPASMVTAGVALARVLWVSVRDETVARSLRKSSSGPFTRKQSALLKAAELVLDAGGFGLVVIDFGDLRYPIPQSSALRLARAAERSGSVVIALASHRMCGTFASLSIAMNRVAASFGRTAIGGPAVFDALEQEARVARNKFGGSGGRAIISAIADAAIQLPLPFMDTVQVSAAAHPTVLHGGGN